MVQILKCCHVSGVLIVFRVCAGCLCVSFLTDLWHVLDDSGIVQECLLNFKS